LHTYKVKQLLLENTTNKIKTLEPTALKSTTTSHVSEERDYAFFVR